MTMTEPSEPTRRRRRNTPETPPPAAGSVARGLVLVVVAFIVGVVLLRDDDGVAAIGQVGAGTIDDVVSGSGDDDPTATTIVATTTTTVRAQATVTVLVANGSGVTGAAGTTTERVVALGYLTLEATNAERVAASQIFYVAGYEAEAQRLAEELSPSAPPQILPMPSPAPVAELGGANLLVVLGPDLAPQP